MNGPEHYQAAEQLLNQAEHTTEPRKSGLIAAAHAHIQLADLAHRVASGITWMAPKGSELVSAWADLVGPTTTK
jgi:hypothetical protein